MKSFFRGERPGCTHLSWAHARGDLAAAAGAEGKVHLFSFSREGGGRLAKVAELGGGDCFYPRIKTIV